MSLVEGNVLPAVITCTDFCTRKQEASMKTSPVAVLRITVGGGVCVYNILCCKLNIVHYSADRVLSFFFRLSRAKVGAIEDDRGYFPFYKGTYSLDSCFKSFYLPMAPMKPNAGCRTQARQAFVSPN